MSLSFAPASRSQQCWEPPVEVELHDRRRNPACAVLARRGEWRGLCRIGRLQSVRAERQHRRPAGELNNRDIVETAPAVANGVVYIGANDFNVYALNASIGALLWSYATSFFVAILARGGKWGGLCRLVRRDKCSLSNYTLSLGDVLMRYALSEKASAPGLQRGRAAHVGTPPQIANRAEEAYGTRGDLAGLGRWSE